MMLRYIGRQIGKLLTKSGVVTSMENLDVSQFHDDTLYSWTRLKQSKNIIIIKYIIKP